METSCFPVQVVMEKCSVFVIAIYKASQIRKGTADVSCTSLCRDAPIII